MEGLYHGAAEWAPQDRAVLLNSQATSQDTCVVTFRAKAALLALRLHRLAIQGFRVSVIVTYTCRRAVRWPRG